jgi:hypothetical protein
MVLPTAGFALQQNQYELGHSPGDRSVYWLRQGFHSRSKSNSCDPGGGA